MVLLSPAVINMMLLDLTYFDHTRTSLTSILHNSLLSIIFFSSSVHKPVSLLNWSTYVIAGLPLFLVHFFGSQTSI